MTKDLILKNILICLIIIVSFLGFYILRIGSFIFIPVIISIFSLILIFGIYEFFFKFLKNKYLSIFATFGIFVLFFLIVGFIVTTQIDSFIKNSSKFSEGITNIINLLESIGANFGFDLKEYFSLEYIKTLFSNLNFPEIGKKAYSGFTSFSSAFLTTIVILLFIFLERKNFKEKAKYLFDLKGREKIKKIYAGVTNDLNLYFSTKFLLALINGVVATIIMSLFGLDFALTFGFLVFVLDFIPIIGALIALGLPFIYSLVTFDNVGASFFLLVCLYVPQVITGNIIEPKIMGDRLNLSSFVLVLSLLFWVEFWGIIGAFLAIPIMATINVILSKFESTKFISVLLGGKIKK